MYVIVFLEWGIQDYVHPEDQTLPTFEMTPRFKPFTETDNRLKSIVIVINRRLISISDINRYKSTKKTVITSINIDFRYRAIDIDIDLFIDCYRLLLRKT